jgi:HAD superfamily hydrolase (TIGR01509 family)
MCGEDIEIAKPHPSCYKECYKKFRISPQEALIFEDGVAGIEAAKKSGGNYCVVKF